ncbi:hypothetical protein [Thorsellia anophelis]|uniref:Uncharacterized protein n=1 Tax=Thorsellia anophelis DSM 18579 TaxID=1123402 RepID=A0A1I0FH89_9GAMM|nr:hypothetical protein [Thorsellia anophelis]SET57328.1 hypothetical protein SAMN02583745_02761 [Thorsellia anophelis DSM 18579]
MNLKIKKSHKYLIICTAIFWVYFYLLGEKDSCSVILQQPKSCELTTEMLSSITMHTNIKPDGASLSATSTKKIFLCDIKKKLLNDNYWKNTYYFFFNQNNLLINYGKSGGIPLYIHAINIEFPETFSTSRGLTTYPEEPILQLGETGEPPQFRLDPNVLERAHAALKHLSCKVFN